MLVADHEEPHFRAEPPVRGEVVGLATPVSPDSRLAFRVVDVGGDGPHACNTQRALVGLALEDRECLSFIVTGGEHGHDQVVQRPSGFHLVNRVLGLEASQQEAVGLPIVGDIEHPVIQHE